MLITRRSPGLQPRDYRLLLPREPRIDCLACVKCALATNGSFDVPHRSIRSPCSMSAMGRERLGRSVSSDRNIACICGPTHRSMGRSARAGDRR